MEQNPNKNFIYNAFELVRFVWDRKWIIIALCGLAFIISAIVSLSITPRYKSQVILFPAADVSLSKSLLETSSISMDSRDVLSFGKDDEAERMLQILNSGQIKAHIVEKFDLMIHYSIDVSSKYPYTQLNNKFRGNIKFRRNEFMSIAIEVLDTDPQMAADIANEIAVYIDSTIHNIQRERALEAFNIVEREYLDSQHEIDVLSDSLKKIRLLGVIDYESQASSLSASLANALEAGKTNTAEAIQKRMNTLSTYGGIYVELSKKLESEIDRLGQLKVKYASTKINVEQSVPQIFIVDKASKAEQKALPKRTFIVIISTLSVFAITILFLVIADNIHIRN